jgi:predicted transcriptional regulator YdeE
MEIFTLKDDMEVFCVTAKSFPYEIKQAFGSLINLLPGTEGRTFFGVSYQNKNGDMVYKAAVLESFEGEAAQLGCERLTIEKGEYLVERLTDWKKNESQIGLTFKKFATSKYNATFPCVEWYQGDDVVCMVRLYKSW